MEITTNLFGRQEKLILDKDVNFYRMILLMEAGSVLFFTLFPLFFNLPYRINLYLTWEGAYRLYLGQVPFKDFGMPLGYGFFITPAIFFFIFGPATRTLIYAQVFMNLLTIYFYRGILKELGLSPIARYFSILVFTISYTFIFFWPWYNHTAYLYEIAGLYFIIKTYSYDNYKKYLSILAASAFTFFSFFTKQDYGGMTLLFSIVLIAYQAYHYKDYKIALTFIVALAVTASVCILPLVKYNFLYWFNYGQAPHDSRIAPIDLLNEAFGNSAWEKFYLVVIFIIAVGMMKNFKSFIGNKNQVLLFLLSIGMIVEALIVKVTSKNSLDTTTFYHGFACAFILSTINIKEHLKNIYLVAATSLLVVIWWSGMYWKYANRIFHFAAETTPDGKAAVQKEVWRASSIPMYAGVNLPEGTTKGIKRIKQLPVVLNKKGNLRVLNMSELTGLAHEIPYTPATNIPLWYHLNIGMFDKQVGELSAQVRNHEYDMVLFEVIPSLDNFYPEAVREELKKHYHLTDSFVAPRKEGDSHIEVYVINK